MAHTGVRLSPMGIGLGCTDRNALIRQMEKSLRDVAVLLHDNDQDLV